MSKQTTIPPHLQAAFDQIHEILSANDIAGVVMLHAEQADGPGFMVSTIKLDPSYSGVYWTGKVLQVKELPETRRIPSTDEFEPKGKTVAKTLNMLGNFRLRLNEVYQLFGAADMLVRSKNNIIPKNQSNGQDNEKR